MASWTVARVRGIPLRLHWTLLLILPFFAYIMAAQYFTEGEPVTATGLAWGGALAITLFASILLHELSHSFMALHYGGKVRSILLMPLGGVSQMESMPERPREEFMVTLVGPLTNYVIAAPLLVWRYVLGVPASPADLSEFVQWAAWLNVAVGSFNLFLPAFPLDGGRLLRAALASRMGPLRATHVAARVGKVLAFALGVFGILAFNVGGLWFVLIAFFIYVGAGAEESATTVQTLLKDLHARDLMTADPVALSPDDDLEDALGAMMRTRHVAFPVVEDGRVVGCIGLDEMAGMDRERLAHVPVRQAMSHEVPSVAPDTPAADVLRMLQDSPHRHVVVVDGGRLVGLVSGTDLQRVVRVLDAVGTDTESRPPASASSAGTTVPGPRFRP